MRTLILSVLAALLLWPIAALGHGRVLRNPLLDDTAMAESRNGP